MTIRNGSIPGSGFLIIWTQTKILLNLNLLCTVPLKGRTLIRFTYSITVDIEQNSSVFVKINSIVLPLRTVSINEDILNCLNQ